MGDAPGSERALEPVPANEAASSEPEEGQETIARRTTAELALHRTTVQSFEFSGPLPPPQILRLRRSVRWMRGTRCRNG